MTFFFQVAEIQALSSRLEVQNLHLTSDLQQCERSRNETIIETTRQLQLKQKTHDDQVDNISAEMFVHMRMCGRMGSGNKLRDPWNKQTSSVSGYKTTTDTVKIPV